MNYLFHPDGTRSNPFHLSKKEADEIKSILKVGESLLDYPFSIREKIAIINEYRDKIHSRWPHLFDNCYVVVDAMEETYFDAWFRSIQKQ